MIYGLCGASGTGKTTLAKMVSEKMNMRFVPTSITQMARNAGYNAVGSMTLSQRLDLQEKLADQFELLLGSIEGHAILDRTPIDMLGYMLGEVHMQSHEQLTPKELARLTRYIARCKRMTVVHFDHVFVTSLLPSYEVTDTRPAENFAYQYHTHMLMLGMVLDCGDRLRQSIFLSTDLKARAGYMESFLSDRIVEVEEMRRSARFLN